MKKFLFLVFFILCFTWNVFAGDSFFGPPGNRIKLTTVHYGSPTSVLVKNANAEIWSINFIATASNGNFYVLDATTDTTGTNDSDMRSEGQQATSGNSYNINYGNVPLQLNKGLYLVVNNGQVVITYD